MVSGGYAREHVTFLADPGLERTRRGGTPRPQRKEIELPQEWESAPVVPSVCPSPSWNRIECGY